MSLSAVNVATPFDKMVPPHLLLEVYRHTSSCLLVKCTQSYALIPRADCATDRRSTVAFKLFEEEKHGGMTGMQIVQSFCCNLSFRPPHRKCSSLPALLPLLSNYIIQEDQCTK